MPGMSRLGDVDVHLFAEGTHARAYEGFGAHVARRDATPAGVLGVDFAVWAPNADSVHVIGDFESWGERPAPLKRRGETGIWEARVTGVGHGTRYKYRVVSRNGGYQVDKADPYGFRCEEPPATASIVWDLDYGWEDGSWMKERRAHNALDAADVDLRGAPRLVDARPRGKAPLAQLPRDRAQAGGACAALRLHAHRADAHRRAPVLSVVGLPGDRLLRAHVTLRDAPGFHVVRRPPAPAGDRRDPRLDARALPDRRARPDLLRRHAPLRARRPAPGDARRMGQRHLQLRPERGAQLPDLERALLARPLSHRRAARRRGRVDAVPRLRAQGRRLGPERVRRQREPGGDRSSCASSTRRSTASTPTCRRSPRSRPPGRACRARPTRAASGSG